MKNLDLGKENISKLFVQYAIPSVIGLLVVSLYSIVDGIFIGRIVGPDGLAAVNICMPFISFTSSIGVMIAVGGVTLTTIKMGEGSIHEASKKFSFTLLLLAISSIIITIFSLIFLEELTIFLGANQSIFHYVKDYLGSILIFSIFFMGGYALDLFLRSDGKPNLSMLFILIGTLLNICLDYLFIVKWNLSVKGAAYATGISELVSFTLLFCYFLSTKSKLKLVKPHFDKSSFLKILYNGSSEFLSEISMGLVTFVYNLIMMKYFGPIGVSAVAIIMYISTIVYMVIYGIAQGISPIISYNYGAKKYIRIFKILKLAISTSFVIGILSFILMFFNIDSIVSIFIKGNIEVSKIASYGGKFFSITFLLCGFNIISSTYFTAIGNAKASAIISLSRTIIFQLITVVVFTYIFGSKGMWISQPFADLLTLILSFVFIRQSKRLLINANN
ncbi:MATE family efflux transporter [Lutibacter sp. B2]|nr:MATE family efflux transporter [Lutibacter sp. B2]